MIIKPINPAGNLYMKTHPSVTVAEGSPNQSTRLSDLVDRISGSLAPAAHHNKSHIINNVPEEIYLQISDDNVAAVLSRLMNIVIHHSENSCVRISAKIFNDVVLLHLKDDGCVNYDTISLSLNDVQKQAEKIGGFVGFTSYRNKLTTIAFSFTNNEQRRPNLFN